MFQAVQDLELNTGNPTSKKLEFVKLFCICITLGFTLTLTVLISEDKDILSKLRCAMQSDFPIMSESKRCQNYDRFNLSSGLYATHCKANFDSYLIIQQTKTGGKVKSEVSLNSEQWNILKLKVDGTHAVL